MTSQGPDLCVLGDFAWDVLVKSDTELKRGGDTFGDVRLTPGGSAANVAVWAQRLGAHSHFVGKIGTDRLGELAREDLADENVESTLALSTTRRTGSVAVLLDHHGERSMVSGFGADFYLVPTEVPFDVVRRSRHLHLTAWSLFNDPPRTAALDAANAAARAGATISLDPASFQVLEEFGADAFIKMTAPLGIDVMMPNKEEAAVLVGGEFEPDQVASKIAELYPGSLVVLKLDADGALIREADGTSTAIAPAAGSLLDATGAGDSFAGAFLAQWLNGTDAATAARVAAEVAAWVIGQRGSRPTCPPELLNAWRAAD